MAPQKAHPRLAASRLAASGHTAPSLATHIADLVRTFRTLLDPYRPELHYMRGPGPKWHAKHARVPVEAIDTRALMQVKA